MAKKKQTKKTVKKAKKPDLVLRVNRVDPTPNTAGFSNHFAVQKDGEIFHLLFYDVQPPLILEETSESDSKRYAEAGTIDATRIARIVVPRSVIPGMIAALQDQYDKGEDARDTDIPDKNGKH